MKNCTFCNKKKMKEDGLYETDNFYVVVGLALTASGHVMLIPKRHYPSFGDLPEELEEEYEELKKLVIKKVRNSFFDPFLIEYGAWGQSVLHAHIHFIPLKSEEYEVKSIMKEMISPGKIHFEEVDRKKLKEIYRVEKGYVSVEEGGKLYLGHVKDVSHMENWYNPHISQRAFFTQIKGLKGVSGWRKMSDEDKNVDEVKRKLTKKKLNFN